MNKLSDKDHIMLSNLIKLIDPNQSFWCTIFINKNGILSTTCNFCNVTEISSDFENKNLTQFLSEHGIKHLKLKAFL